MPGLLRRAGCGALVALALGGAAPRAGAAEATRRPVSVAGCAAAAERAVRVGITIRTLPPACRGLRPLGLQQAAIAAINELAGPWPKARHRHLAAIAASRLRRLLMASPAPTKHDSPRPSAAPVVAAGRPIPVDLVALAAWLLTVASGVYLLAGWIAHGGLRRAGRRGRPPPVILSHFGLATAGLACWTGYVLSGAVAVAWLAVFLLLPVAGLGIATLMLAIPDAAPRASTAQRSRLPVVAIATHGILATVTMLLVLLAAIAAH